MRQSSMGTVLWALQRDRQALLEFRKALESVEAPCCFAKALQPTCRAVASSVAQVALHEFAADPAASPHIEPRDSRWSLFPFLPHGVLEELCESIANYSSFADQAKTALSQAIQRIKDSSEVEDGIGQHGALAELLRTFLVLFGIGMGDVLEQNDVDFASLLGKVAEQNEENHSPLYPFTKPGRISR